MRGARMLAMFFFFIPVYHGTSESAMLDTELEPQARDAAEFLVGDGGCPAAELVGVVDSDDDVESGELEVFGAKLVAKPATDLREARPARCVGFYVQGGLRNQSVLIDPVEQFLRKLKEMRLLFGDDVAFGSMLIRHHGVDLGGAGFECCLLILCSQSGVDNWWLVVRLRENLLPLIQAIDAIGDAMAGIAQVLHRLIASFHYAIAQPGAKA